MPVSGSASLYALPPMWWRRSITVTLRPAFAARSAIVSPKKPEPTTRRSVSIPVILPSDGPRTWQARANVTGSSRVGARAEPSDPPRGAPRETPRRVAQPPSLAAPPSHGPRVRVRDAELGRDRARHHRRGPVDALARVVLARVDVIDAA